tara:strand:+ start:2140 stop:2448 length:309 start_codon:yes stop_codon:yes gene_type:complete
MADRLRSIKIKRDKETKNRYYKNIEYPEIPISENDVYIISKSTDRLDLLAQDYYSDIRLWWVISKANPNKIKRDSLFINPGLQIRIPSDIETIYLAFEKLNQ